MTEQPFVPLQAELSAADDHDLQTVLAAWHDATLRLEQTHEALRAEVRRLTDELEVKNRELARKNRLADLGQMASHVAHEVRNNLVPVTLYLSLLRRRIWPTTRGSLGHAGQGRVGLHVAGCDGQRPVAFHGRARSAARAGSTCSDLVEDVCDSLAPQLSAQGIDTRDRRRRRGWSILADRDMLRRAVLNWCSTPSTPCPTAASWSSPPVARPARRRAGNGRQRRRAFPTTRAAGPSSRSSRTKSSGTGLGLAIVVSHRRSPRRRGRPPPIVPKAAPPSRSDFPHRAMEAAA